MFFKLLPRGSKPPEKGHDEIYLIIDNWNDFSFVTNFYVYAFDQQGQRYELGVVKIGFEGQTKESSTHSKLEQQFDELPYKFFSLGAHVEYYQQLGSKFSEEFKQKYLAGLRDIVFDSQNLKRASGEDVFGASLLRDVSMSSIKGQFARVLQGGVPLTDFEFSFIRPPEKDFSGIDIEFVVEATSKPSTNIHAIIGRNGVGKTTILNSMIEAITKRGASAGKFETTNIFQVVEIDSLYFSGLVSVSFSAFDPFSPPPEQADPELGPRYSYIGLKDYADDSGALLKPLNALHQEFLTGLRDCFRDASKRLRWLNAIRTLESDENFSEMKLTALAELTSEDLNDRALLLMKDMSSGHAIVLLTITKLVEKVEEKTLVLIDEPESHLHPPLLSALTRALSELLFSRNGVAIIATHSPVVLQEIPKSCVWKITRSRLAMSTTRPEIETFGENVGILTREVFGLEVIKSGYHTLLEKAVQSGADYDEIVAEFQGCLGYEARAVLRAMIARKPVVDVVQ